MKYILSILFFLSPYILWAQETTEDKKTKIEKIVAAFLTQKLDLTAEEATAFMPVFKKYMKEYRAAVKDEDDEIKKNEAIVTVQKKFKPQFKEILKTDERTNKAFKVHQQLVNKLKQVKERREEKKKAKAQVV